MMKDVWAPTKERFFFSLFGVCVLTTGGGSERFSTMALFLMAKRAKTTMFLEAHESDRVQTLIDILEQQFKRDCALIYQSRMLPNEKVGVSCQHKQADEIRMTMKKKR